MVCPAAEIQSRVSPFGPADAGREFRADREPHADAFHKTLTPHAPVTLSGSVRNVFCASGLNELDGDLCLANASALTHRASAVRSVAVRPFRDARSDH